MAGKNKKLVSMAKQFSGLPMKELIGAPLVAATNANNMMALSQTKFLLETCFSLNTQGEKEIYKPIMINMTLTRPVINSDGTEGDPMDSDFNLPLLTIIPLNSLAVNDIKVAFEMEVKSSFSLENSTDSSAENTDNNAISRKINNDHVSAELNGVVAASNKLDSNESASYQKSNSAKYEISAEAGQIPLPIGVLTIIDTFSKSIAPIQLKDDGETKQLEP